MKKSLLFIALLILLASCSSNSHGSKNNIMASLFNSEESSVASIDVVDSFIDSNESSIDIPSAPAYEKIDVDLTTMSSTMVYSQVLTMLDHPSDFVGKTIKMVGPFRPFASTNPDYCYPAIVVEDATACCASGIEFLLYGIPRCSPKGGDGYPALNERATIVGRFETYLEGTSMYVHLVDAIWLKDA